MPAFSARLQHLTPPKPVMVTALKVAVVALVPVVVAGLTLGSGGLILSLLVVATALSQATYARGPVQFEFVGLVALFAALGTFGHRHPTEIALIAGAAALTAYPANRVSAGLLTLVPAIAVLEGLALIGLVWWQAALVALLAGSYTVVVVRIVRARSVPTPVPKRSAAMFTLVLTVAVGVIAYIVARHNLPHGYWMILTMTIVMRPTAYESAIKARDRVIGTVGGALLAIAIAEVLPTSLAYAASALLAWLLIGYTLAKRPLASVVVTSVLVIILVSATESDNAIGVAGQRLLWTAVGAAIAVMLGLITSRFGSSVTTDRSVQSGADAV